LFAEEVADESDEDIGLFALSLEKIGEIKVISASKTKETARTVSVPISVVAAEDIHYGGMTNLYEALQFSPSIDMLQIDRNRYALGVHGLHDVFSERTATLVNGRAADSPLYGGSEFLRLPLFMEDIQQVEILRSPSGAVWGGNALNGVINVITKKPLDVKGGLISSQINDFGDNYQFLRYADGDNNSSWRVSTGYENQDTSSGALNDKFTSLTTPPNEFESRDFRRKFAVDSELFKSVDKDTTISYGLGYSHTEMGDFEYLALYPKQNGFMETTRAYTKIEKEVEHGTNYLQWYGNFSNTKYPSLSKYFSAENYIDGQLVFSLGEDHITSTGATLQIVHIDQDIMSGQEFVADSDPIDEQQVSGFFLDKWKLSEEFSLESQIRGEYHSENQSDWAGRLTGYYNFDDSLLRFSVARAYKSILPNLRVMGGTLPALTVVSNDSLNNERVKSYEVGYNRMLSPDVSFWLNGYFQEYEDMIGYSNITPGTFKPLNIGSARAYGIEPELSIQKEKYKLSAWYNYNIFETREKAPDLSEAQEVRGYLPAKHKVGATLRIFLPDKCTLNLNYKGSALTSPSGPIGGNVSQFQRLDVTVTKEFMFNHNTAEMQFGVSDLFDRTDILARDQGAVQYPHEVPGRTFWARLQMKF
jgi:iron complex outermembrane receptor protein